MWPFTKKEDTIESLMNDCSKLYSDFKFSFTLAHYKSYADLKQTMNNHFLDLRKSIGEEDNEKVVKSLLIHLKEQLTFFQKHPFSCSEVEYNKFAEKNLPYMEKIEQLILNEKSHQNKMKI